MNEEQNQQPQLSPLVSAIATLLVRYYKSFFEVRNPDLVPLEQLGERIFDFQKDLRYNKPFICSLMLEALRKSEDRDTWAVLIQTAYDTGVTAGLSEYDAIDQVVDVFDIEWTNNVARLVYKIEEPQQQEAENDDNQNNLIIPNEF